MRGRKGIGGHQSSQMRSEDWITPLEIIEKLGPFDLDPCAAAEQPWACADESYTELENGLMLPWRGLVWLNPPYGKYTDRWLNRMALHNNGVALIFARTETKMFFDHVWDYASAMLFIKGRLYFHYPDGTRASANSGGPSVLVAYGNKACGRLRNRKIEGKWIDLRPASNPTIEEEETP